MDSQEFVFGIIKMDKGPARYYIVWKAPAPADDTEPVYVLPLFVSPLLTAAEHFLHTVEDAYAAGKSAAGTPVQPIVDIQDTEGDPYAGTDTDSTPVHDSDYMPDEEEPEYSR